MSTRTLRRVQTARLSLERLGPEHAPDLIALLRDPRVAATTWPNPEPPSEAEVIGLLEAKISHWERHGFGYWIVKDRTTGATVGRGGLQRTTVAGTLETEAGWAITPQRWGEGLATELALACTEVAFHDLCLSEIVAFSFPDNIRSRRVMGKSGFAYERDVIHAGLPHVLYRCAR